MTGNAGPSLARLAFELFVAPFVFAALAVLLLHDLVTS